MSDYGPWPRDECGTALGSDYDRIMLDWRLRSRAVVRHEMKEKEVHSIKSSGLE